MAIPGMLGSIGSAGLLLRSTTPEIREPAESGSPFFLGIRSGFQF
jgi:hypothetical protein